LGWKASVCGLVGAAIVLIGTARFGIATSPDSAAYLSAARSLVAGNGFIRYDDEPYTHWPPMVPLLLAAAGRIGIEQLTAFRYVNAACFGLTVLLTGLTLGDRVLSLRVWRIGMAAVLCAYPLVRINVYAWSEGVFVLFLVLFARSLDAYLRKPSLWIILGCGVWAACAILTRYIGLIVVPVGLWIIFLGIRRSPGRAIRDAALFLILAMTPIVIWLIRNQTVSGTPTGWRTEVRAPLWRNAWLMADAVSQWILPEVIPTAIRCAALAAFLALILILWIRYEKQHSVIPGGLRSAAWSPWVCLTATYALGLVVATSTIELGATLDQRFASPLFIPMLVILVPATELVFSNARLFGNRWLWRSAGLAVCVWIGYLAIGTAGTVWYYGWRGGGFSAPQWRESPTIAYLRANPLPGEIHSNHPSVIYLLTGRNAKFLPRRTGEPTLDLWIKDVSDTLANGTTVHIIWWNQQTREATYRMEELESVVPLTLERDLGDSILYRVRGQPAAPNSPANPDSGP